jgi:hypothetical protein
MEPKLVSTLSETRRLFRLFRFNIETACSVFRLNRNNEKGTKQTEKDIKLVNKNMNVQCCQGAEISAAKHKKGQKNCMWPGKSGA